MFYGCFSRNNLSIELLRCLTWRGIQRLDPNTSRLDPLLMGLTSAIFGTLFAGIFDHHFFDMTFPHFATIYWLLMGLAVSATYLVDEPEEGNREPSMNPLPLILDGAKSS